MELKQLHYFLAVAEHGSFTRAADAIGRTQQALSKGILTLEQQLGEPLFQRGTREARLTRAGSLLLDHARTVDAAVRRFEERLSDLQTGAEGQLHIGTGPTPAGSLVAPAVRALRSQWPGIRVHVRGGIAPRLLPALLARELDLVVTLDTLADASPDPRIHEEILLHDGYRILAAADHPLAASRAIEPARLLEYPWIFGKRLGAVERAFGDTFRRHGLTPPAHAMETDSLEFLGAMVSDGAYLTLLPSRLAAARIRHDRWRALDVPDFTWQGPVKIYTRNNEPQDAPMARLLKALRDAAGQATAEARFT